MAMFVVIPILLVQRRLAFVWTLEDLLSGL